VGLLRLEALAPARGLRGLVLRLRLGGGSSWARLGSWLSAFLMGRLRPVLERLPVGAVAIAIAIVVALAIRIAVAVPKTPVITPEGPVVAIIVVAAVLTRLLVTLVMLRGGLEGRLWEAAIVEQIVGVVLAKIVTAFEAVIGPTQALLAVTVVALTRLMHLLAISHDDPAVVLRVLEIVLSQHGIARGLGVARKGDVFLGDMRGRTANFHVRPVRLKAAR